MTSELHLEGLDCAGCAAKIENKVSKLPNVKEAKLNFVTKELKIETSDQEYLKEIIDQTKSIVNKLEPHVIVTEKNNIDSIERVLYLDGLDCAGCAAKIENNAGNMKEIISSSLDFVNKKLRLEIEASRNIDLIVKDIEKMVIKLEPHVKVEDITFEKKENVEEVKRGIAEILKENAKKVVGAGFFVGALLVNFDQTIQIAMFMMAYILVGGDVLKKAFKNILNGQIFDENFLMSIATIGAIVLGEYAEAVGVMLFYEVGEGFQSYAVNNSRKSIKALLNIKPEYANLKLGSKSKTVSPEEVKVGDIIVVKPGEKIPLDGEVISGKTMVDTSALTGESVPRSVSISEEVLAGFINTTALIEVKVTKIFKDSQVSKILDMVENASSKKAPTEQFITKFSRYYTPAVVIGAVLISIIPPMIIEGATFAEWARRALIFLVVSCPCALVVSVPLGFFGGIGSASKQGILIKGGNYLEALNEVDTIVFDKTGTLTKGVFEVTEIKNKLVTKDELLRYAAIAEVHSNHPIAKSIVKRYDKHIDESEIKSYEEISGHGVKVKYENEFILAGNKKLMDKEGIKYEVPSTVGTVVHVAKNERYLGYIIIADEIKEDSKKLILNLKETGVKETVMLTGDIKDVAENVANTLSIDKVHFELLPEHKVHKFEEIEKNKSKSSKIAFVGDGINDAPVLARADVGIAMGGLGSDAAIEAADVVLMTDEPSKIVTAIRIAKKTRTIVLQNIVFALSIKLIVIGMGALGIATMWEAVFADVGVALLAVLNSSRILKFK